MPRPAENLLTGFIQAFHRDDAAIRAELVAGLLAEHAAVHPKFLYDPLGSKLFEAICELPEYYPTRMEAAIFARHLPALADVVGAGITLIDLGAGNCAKAARLFDALMPRQYVPVDISVEFLREAVAQIRQRHPELPVTGVGLDFSQSLELPDAVGRTRRLFFYPGSSIGNFTPGQALAFLRRMCAACHDEGGEGGGLLIGVDLVKEKRVLDAAYDDALGVTAAFNLNLLQHLNTLLGADFDLRDWRHRGFFNAAESCVEMHLEARRDVEVAWLDGRRRFAEGERIHTESSYKYTRDGFLRMLEEAGFVAPRTWTDERGWFMVCHARASH
ncbi:L-histidine N(alpha)-methyltransferase [Janthinobacterium sp. 17J80-10]|uniref:L-histidine N(alpha)-methyltransferase n=1 Tax=Janthinobacterium sp. 17J80-10 TaxID=2497863 RepID=UPI00100598D7|nr:L-histidine N(alpha)-methyltransferase [Janthinobacterium sp. 17J80-10]QAU34071.1 L-histidine N(alpha)-methyltransferase [Janthinobacterium sp. 17J80-10]